MVPSRKLVLYYPDGILIFPDGSCTVREMSVSSRSWQQRQDIRAWSTQSKIIHLRQITRGSGGLCLFLFYWFFIEFLMISCTCMCFVWRTLFTSQIIQRMSLGAALEVLPPPTRRLVPGTLNFNTIESRSSLRTFIFFHYLFDWRGLRCRGRYGQDQRFYKGGD